MYNYQLIYRPNSNPFYDLAGNLAGCHRNGQPHRRADARSDHSAAVPARRTLRRMTWRPGGFGSRVITQFQFNPATSPKSQRADSLASTRGRGHYEEEYSLSARSYRRAVCNYVRDHAAGSFGEHSIGKLFSGFVISGKLIRMTSWTRLAGRPKTRCKGASPSYRRKPQFWR